MDKQKEGSEPTQHDRARLGGGGYAESPAKITRRTAIGVFAAAGGLIVLGVTGVLSALSCGASRNANGGGMMGGMTGGMMGNVSSADMNIYMDMFNRHTEITRTV